MSYKKECQEKNLPHRLNTHPFLSLHSAPLLERALLTESGLPQAEPYVSSPRAKRRYASSPPVGFISLSSYKKECQEKNLPHRLNTHPFLSRHSAPLLERALLTESGLPQAEPYVSSPRAKRRYASSPLWVSFRYRDGAHRF